MSKKIKTSVVIIGVGILVYLVSLGNITMADIGSAASEEMSAGATISLEACLVRVDIEALEKGEGNSGFLPLSSISAEQVLSCIKDDKAEVVSNVKVLVAEGSVAEIATENNGHEKEKDKAKETGGNSERKTGSSLRAEVVEVNDDGIAVEFKFRQNVSENSSSGHDDGEVEEEHSDVFELSSRLGLRVGRPVIAGAKKSEDGAQFLILFAEL